MSQLLRRQKRLYTYTVSLYKPALLAAAADIEAIDAQTQYVEAFTNVPAYYKSTPELDSVGIAGRSPGVNLLVLDEWHFASDQSLADTWIIKMTGSDPRATPHPNIGRLWVILDNSQQSASQGRRRNGWQMVYALISNVPGLSTHVDGLS